jgi:hypothetical protein
MAGRQGGTGASEKPSWKGHPLHSERMAEADSISCVQPFSPWYTRIGKIGGSLMPKAPCFSKSYHCQVGVVFPVFLTEIAFFINGQKIKIKAL